MGCGQKAVADDREDWDYFKKQTGLTGVNWDVYSQSAHYATKIYDEFRWKGDRLKLAVKHALELHSIRAAQALEVKQFEEYEKLRVQFS